jgi:flagellar basal-body rod modification protein FlgD
MDIKGLVAPVVDGKVQNSNASSKSLASASEKDKSQIDSEAFLTLLVAEMQNQDPLEPTSNTEWISQYATFTQVSEVQAIGDSMNAMKADSLTGKTVIMSVRDDSGNTDEVSGVVDYVTYEEGKAYLSIDGSLYSINDLKTVVSDRYVAASDRADDLIEAIKQLPAPSLMTKDYFNAASAVVAEYDDMNDFEKGFLDESFADGIDQYRKALQKIITDEQAKQEKAAAELAAEQAEAVTETAADKAAEAVTPASGTEASADSGDTGAGVSESAEAVSESSAAAAAEDEASSETSAATEAAASESASETAASSESSDEGTEASDSEPDDTVTEAASSEAAASEAASSEAEEQPSASDTDDNA